MALKRVQLVRHDASGSATFLGKIGEVTVNTSANSLIIHDNVTIGGFEQARADLNNVSSATTLIAGKMSPAHVAQLDAATAGVATNVINIATNVADIAINVTNIATNVTAIATNATAIATNVTNIAGKAAKPAVIVANNLQEINASGDLEDSGESLVDVHNAANLTGTVPEVSVKQASTIYRGSVKIATLSEVSLRTNAINAITPSSINTLFAYPGALGATTPNSAVVTTLTSTGAVTVGGAFTSPGIDDNGTATAITINVSNNVSIGSGGSGKLSVASNSPTLNIYTAGAGNSGYLKMSNVGGFFYSMECNVDGDLAFFNGTNYSMYFRQSGSLRTASSECVLDDDTMSANSVDHLCSQQSIKAYVDNSQGALAALDSVAAAQIDANAVGNSEMADNAITDAEIDFSFDASSSWSIALSGTQVIPAGIYAVSVVPVGDAQIAVQIFTGSVWFGSKLLGSTLISDGTNVRIIEIVGNNGATVHYRKLA